MAESTGPNKQRGAPPRKAMILVAASLILVAFAILMIKRGPKSPSSRLVPRADMRTLATALESYFVDFNVYPAHTEIPSEAFMGLAAPGTPTFRMRNGLGLQTITTPTAYVTMLLPDPYGIPESRGFCYYTNGDNWLLWSAGPDHTYEIDPVRDLAPIRGGSLEALILVGFDPTNGTVSRGDIWRIRQ